MWVFGNGVDVFILVARVFRPAEFVLAPIQVGRIVFVEELATLCEGVAVGASPPCGWDSAAVGRVLAVLGEVMVPAC